MNGAESMERPGQGRRNEASERPDASLLPGFLEEAVERWRVKGSTIAQNRDKVTAEFLASDRFILEALPGAGKTTVAPVEFLRALLESKPDARVVVTEPRILAVEAMAEYVGSETSKDFVDYQHREHPIEKPDSRLRFVVEQSLRNELIRDPKLPNVDCVVLDEIHSADPILLGLLKKAQALRKNEGLPQLKLVLTSGTVDVESFRKYLDDETAEVKTLTVEGHKYKINEHFLDSPINPDGAPSAAAEKVKGIISDPKNTSDILIFMPGRREIAKTKEALTAVLENTDIEIVTITGGDSDGNPYAKISNNPHNRRRIYIATDVAETAITIPNVDVIDSGLMKKMVYDPRTRLSTLITRAHTKENQTQRKYRAGRTGEGNYYALYTKSELEARDERPMPEFIQRDITSDVLWLYANGQDPYTFDFKDKPRVEILDQAVVTLQKLGAMDQDKSVTQIGREMSEITEDPAHARMLIEARKRGCLTAVALLIGAMKTNKSIFELTKNETLTSKYGALVDPSSDFITFLKAWNKSIETNGEGFNKSTIEAIKRARNNLKQGSSSADVAVIPLETQEQIDAINLSIAAGLASRQIVREGSTFKIEGAGFSGIKIDRSSALLSTGESTFLSGNINSNGAGKISSFANWNMFFNGPVLTNEFEYLKAFYESKRETVLEEEPVDEEAQSVDTVQSTVSENQVQDLSEKIESAPTENVKEEATTFIQKVRENWHKLTDKVKEMYIRFKNAVKRIFRI